MLGGPKPFPSQLRVGIDICQISRLERLVVRCLEENSPRLSTFLRRLLHPREFDALHVWLSRRQAAVPDLRQAKFAAYLAGRWAAKEAAIKAHTHRQLSLKEVWVRRDTAERPEALIAPPRRYVRMPLAVAALRGLRPPNVTDAIHRRAWLRWYDPPLSEYQMADLSISHDGNYATAMIHALDVPSPIVETIEDDGTGDPIHVPGLGDRGYPEILLPDVLYKALTDYNPRDEKPPPADETKKDRMIYRQLKPRKVPQRS